MRQFHARNFAAALPLFEAAEKGPSRDVMHVARQHANMCRQRLPEPEVTTSERPDDLYHEGVTLIAERRLEAAEKRLRQALAGAPETDYILYALGLCRGLSGDVEGARQFLEQAIHLNPKNRALARTDADFLEFGRQSPLRELVFGERIHPDRQG